MNIRSPIVMIGIFLALFWTLGLLLTLDRVPRVDEAYVLPTFKAASNIEIDTVAVDRQTKGGEPVEFRFARKDDDWTLRQGSQSIKVDAFKLRDLIKEVREAKRDPDVRVTDNPASYGLQPPQATIVLSGKQKRKGDDAGPVREWKLLLGSETPDKKYVYAATSDRPGLVFALPRNSLNAVFFKNANDLRSKRLFDFSEPTVQSFTIKEGANELEVKKTDDGAWLLMKPNLGYADFEGPQLPKGAPPPEKTPEGGIKNLLAAIAAVRVDSEDDFVPPAPDTLERNDLVPGKEKIRIQIFSGETKKPTEETLLVGRQDKDYYYARLATDEGAFKIPAKVLTPILDALKSPATLRNTDLSPIPAKEADAVTLTIGKDEARFVRLGEPPVWQVELGTSPQTPANGKAVDAMLDALQGRRGVLKFKDVADADAAKFDAELGFDQPQASAAIFLQGVDAGKPKKDAKPAETIVFGKTEGDQVWVKRTMPDGPTARFAVAKSVLDKAIPREGSLGFLETVLPKVAPQNITRIEIDRAGKVLTLHKKDNRWFLKDAAGNIAADGRKIEEIARAFSGLPIRRWVKKLDAKDDLAPLGLKTPDLSLTLTLKKDQLGAAAVGSAIGQLGGIMNDPALVALGSAWGNVQLDGEKVVIAFGKEPTDKDDANNLYVKHSQSDRIGLAPTPFANLLRTTDFRDRSTILQPQVVLAAAIVGAPASQSVNGILSGSPLATGHLGRGEGASVKSLRVMIRTPIEVRTFSFNRDAKGWTDQSGLKEFQIDDEHVTTVADLVASLPVSRFVSLTGGPRDDQKLTAKDATIVIDAVMNDLRPVTVTIGANFDNHGTFMQTTTWPGAIFFVSPERVQPLLQGAGFFAKERLAGN